MSFKRFSFLLAVRLIAIMFSLMGLVFLFTTPGYHAATLLMLCVTAMLTYNVLHFISRTNAEISRFLDAARYADFGQRFNFKNLGAGFEELGDTFTDILERFREVRAGQEEELRHLKALVEHVPVPLISLHQDGSITQWNNAARRLFGSAHVTKTSDLEQFGQRFHDEILSIKTGERKLAIFVVDDVEQRLTVAATQIILAGEVERLISLQDIQSELDIAQLEAWQDLVRVLTHEIMNSITPVASLAKTAEDLIDDVRDRVTDQPDLVEELSDVKDAVKTVARRSDGLMQFVTSYRRLTRLPPPEKTRILIHELFTSVKLLGTHDWADNQIKLHTNISPSELDLNADPKMIEQILINMLQNAGHALNGVDDANVWLNARLSSRGRTIIEIEDNGCGIDPETAQKIFVPFFTTKREGSGVGLALTRQVMIAHGGAITYKQRKDGGSIFTLTF
ncbi:PAS domain-containing sensor histidine kinase [Kordiimonas sp. SCSIO 12610]|uniref:sensor histidine kinase n=1 Tax=Kordiimonas sp. SCSIO 12610 TaxID=2829597 RepID=UPI00210A82FB|nr:ATP-binding protein [Kordiimonas sp. SCSIO 12610]UTW55021.1 PAS domain-containing protein [Kordiimonas sp. SCSIO 12610]